MPASYNEARTTRDLARVLTLRDLVLIVIGTTIGSGIFTVPGAVLRQSGGDVGVALVVWVVGSVLALEWLPAWLSSTRCGPSTR